MAYSVDVFIPFINLHQREYWLPNANRGPELEPGLAWARVRWGALLRVYLWFQIVAGWILTTLLVVGVTGLARPRGS